MTFEEFIQNENPRFFRFATFHRGRKADPYMVFTSETLAKKHPDYLRTGVFLKVWSEGEMHKCWHKCPLIHGGAA